MICSGETESRRLCLPQKQTQEDNQSSWHSLPPLRLGCFGPWVSEKRPWQRPCTAQRWLLSEQPALQKKAVRKPEGGFHSIYLKEKKRFIIIYEIYLTLSPSSKMFQTLTLEAAARKMMLCEDMPILCRAW